MGELTVTIAKGGNGSFPSFRQSNAAASDWVAYITRCDLSLEQMCATACFTRSASLRTLIDWRRGVHRCRAQHHVRHTATGVPSLS
jgi:hypothetical protein